MSRVWTIATREYASFFRVPLAGSSSRSSWPSPAPSSAGAASPPASPRPCAGSSRCGGTLLVIIAPAISMRLFSDELRTGTIEPLLTAPIAEAAVVVGKYFGAVLFLLTLLAPTLLYVILLASLSRPDAGSIIAGYTGVILLGMPLPRHRLPGVEPHLQPDPRVPRHVLCALHLRDPRPRRRSGRPRGDPHVPLLPLGEPTHGRLRPRPHRHRPRRLLPRRLGVVPGPGQRRHGNPEVAMSTIPSQPAARGGVDRRGRAAGASRSRRPS